MTDEAIQRFIEVIDRATAKAIKSKESAHKFLVDAGIVKEKRLLNLQPGKRNNFWSSIKVSEINYYYLPLA